MLWKNFLIFAFLPLSALLLADTRGRGRPTAAPDEAPTKAAAKKGAPKITPGREAAALAFADQHHPELRALLDYLRRESPADYREALADLYQTSERIDQFQDRGDLDRYELEVKLWQAQSRIQLLAARLKVRASEKIRQDLASALEEELELRIQIRKHLRDKVEQRVKRLDDLIARLSSNRESEIARKLRLLTKAGKKSRERLNDSSKSSAEAGNLKTPP